MDLLDKFGIKITEEKVGEGGSAYIHKGIIAKSILDELPEIGTNIAIKHFKSDIFSYDDQFARIRREAEIGTRIRHPNLVRIYAASFDECDLQHNYIFLEWIDGETLSDWAKKQRSNISWARLKNICLPLIDAVEKLHSESVHHRDIKPENVMVRYGSPVLMDVGVAEITSNDDATMNTSMTDFIGSVRYASPQFILGDEEFDVKDDIYSLGITILELLSGEQPYGDVRRKPVIPIEVTRRPPKIDKLRANVPKHITTLLKGCVHQKRERRPTLAQMREAIKSGTTTEYIERELQHLEQESVEFPILQIDDDSAGFVADIGDHNLEFHEEFSVVRKGEDIEVPSLGRNVSSKWWICSAELKHFANNLGNFRMTHEVWVPSENSRTLIPNFFRTGRMQTQEVKKLTVRVGDLVVKRPIRD